MTTRTYVLDTSVLLSDPWAVTRFAEHHVILPLVVISELEGKRHHHELGWFAREALRMLDDLRLEHGREASTMVLPVGGGGLLGGCGAWLRERGMGATILVAATAADALLRSGASGSAVTATVAVGVGAGNSVTRPVAMRVPKTPVATSAMVASTDHSSTIPPRMRGFSARCAPIRAAASPDTGRSSKRSFCGGVFGTRECYRPVPV